MVEHEKNPSSVSHGELLLFRTLWNNTSDHMFIVKLDTAGDFINEACNSSLEKTFGCNSGELDGVKLKDVLDNDAYRSIEKKYNRCIALSKPVTYDENIQIDNGEQRYFNTTILPINDQNGTRIFGISREVTELVKKEQEKLLIEQVKNTQMSELISNIAHQWFQPLSTISTAASGIKLNRELGVNNEQEEQIAIERIMENTQFLSKTVDRYRQRVTSEKEYKEVRVLKRLGIAIDDIKASLENNHIELKYTFDKDLESTTIKTVVGEFSDVIKHILKNSQEVLLKNKIKKPFIEMSIESIEDSLQIRIKDNGGGIDEDILPKVFDLYFTTKHKAQGTGLGLFLCKRIVQEHLGGSIEIKNIDYGVLVLIELPICKPI